jgi:hypothetical protein
MKRISFYFLSRTEFGGHISASGNIHLFRASKAATGSGFRIADSRETPLSGLQTSALRRGSSFLLDFIRDSMSVA